MGAGTPCGIGALGEMCRREGVCSLREIKRSIKLESGIAQNQKSTAHPPGPLGPRPWGRRGLYERFPGPSSACTGHFHGFSPLSQPNREMQL